MTDILLIIIIIYLTHFDYLRKNKISQNNYLELYYYFYGFNAKIGFFNCDNLYTSFNISEFKKISKGKINVKYKNFEFRINGEPINTENDVFLIYFLEEADSSKQNGHCLYFYDEASRDKKYNEIIKDLNS